MLYYLKKKKKAKDQKANSASALITICTLVAGKDTATNVEQNMLILLDKISSEDQRW